jgi:hypothetical protein
MCHLWWHIHACVVILLTYSQPSPTLHALHLTTRPSQYSALHYTGLSSTPHYITIMSDVIRTALLRAPALFHEITDYNAVISLCENRLNSRVSCYCVDGPRDDARLRCF